MSEPYGTIPGSEAESALPGASPDGFDRSRVMRLLERLERDVAAIEVAMAHVEAGEHGAYAAAVAGLEPRLAD